MPNIQVRCLSFAGNNQVRNTPGNDYNWVGGAQAEGIVAELHGKYWTQTYNQKLWCANLATAAAIPISTTTNGITFAVWNPAGNNVVVVPVAFIIGYTGTTGVAGAVGYYYVAGAGSTIATAAPVSAFTGLTVQSGLVGNTRADNAGGSQVRAGSAATVTTAGTLNRWAQFSEATPATNGTQGPYALIEQFDGTMGIPPGVLWYPAANAASGATFMQSLLFYEAPWP